MKQNLRFILLALLCAVFSTAWGGSITFADLNLENGVQYTDPFDGGDFTVTFAGGGNDGKYYDTGSGIRVYSGGTMTIAAKDNKDLTNITITYDGSNKPTSGDVVNVGTYNPNTDTWTGSAESVVFTRPTESGHWRVQKIEVTVGGSSGPVSYTVTYDCNGGTSGCPDEVTDISAGTSITLAAAPTKTDYTFNGWNDGNSNYQPGASYTVNSIVTFTAQWMSNSSQTEALLYESFSGYLGDDSHAVIELNKEEDINRLDYKKWTSFSKVYFGNGGCGKLGTSSAVGSMNASEIPLSGAGTLTFKVKKYGTDSGKLNVTVTGATALGSTSVTPESNWTEYTVNLTDATGNVSITFATSSKRAYIDDIKLVTATPPVQAPVIEPNGGEFAESQTVSISAKDGTIHYTTDGSDPTVESPVYENPFEITTTTTVKAIAINDGETSSVTSAIFTKVEAPVTSLNPASGYVKVGSRILVQFEGQVSKLYYSVNDGEYTEVAVTNYYPITITEDMVVDNKVKINAYHTYTLGETVLQSEIAEATYNVVNPEVFFDTPATIFASELTVKLSASEGATIYYTTENTDPTTEYPSAGITINTTTTFKAIAVVEGISSDVVSATYTKSEAVASYAAYKLVTKQEELQANKSCIIVCRNKNTALGEQMDHEGTAPYRKSVSVTFTDNTQEYIDISKNTDVTVLTLEQEGEFWYLKEGNSYLTPFGTGNYVDLATKSNDAQLTISYTLSSSPTLSFNISAENNLLKYSSQTGRFTRYKSSSGSTHSVDIYQPVEVSAVDLYEKPSEIDNTLTENTIEAQSGVTVNLYRSLTAGVWNAICLPFDMTVTQAKQLFGEGYALEELDDVITDNGNTSINFKLASEFKAGVPYLVLPTQSVAKKAVVVINGVNIVADEPTEVTAGGYSFKGFYNPYNPCGSEDDFKNYFFIGANNKFQYFNSTTTQLRAFRCYFHVPEGSTPANLSLSTDNNGITESISLTEVDGLSTNLTTRVYTISGQYVGKSTDNLSKGMYIVNGRKFIVK